MEQRIYDEFAALEGEHWWFVARRRYLRAIIKRHFKLDDNLLFCEIGCGMGGNLGMLRENADVDAVEMNDAAREQVTRKYQGVVRSIQPGYLPDNIPLKGCYDGVFSLDVIEHVKDDLAALRSLHSLVAENGFMITTVPAYQWLWSEHDVANHHFRRYTKTKYCRLLEEAGFEIKYASYFNTLLFPLAAISRLLGKLCSSTATASSAALSMPHPTINKLLTRLFNIESHWAGRLVMPFGLSIVVVAKCKNVSPQTPSKP